MEVEKLYPLVLVTLVALCYSNSLHCGLVFDDLAAVRDNRDIRSHTPILNLFQNDFWGTPIRKDHSHKSYRPLTVLSFRLNYAVHGLAPFGYHFVNILLHAFICLLFYKLCLHFLSGASSLVSSALFAVHPIHTEAVTGVVGRAELLSAAAFVGALLFYIHNRYHHKANTWQDCGVTSVLAVLGLLCKEQAVTVLVVCCIYEWIVPKIPGRLQSMVLGRSSVSPWWRDKALRSLILLGVFISAVYFRWRIMGTRMPIFSRFDNPAAVSSTPTRQMTYNYLLAVNAWLLLFPCHLCCDWTMSTIPLITDLWDFRHIATLGLYASVLYISRNAVKLEDDAKAAIVMSISLIVLPFVPASNLFFPVGFVVAERVLYIPSMGFCMLVAQGWSALYSKRIYRYFAIFGIVFLLTIHIWKTVKRNGDCTLQSLSIVVGLHLERSLFRRRKATTVRRSNVRDMLKRQSEYTLYRSALAVNQQNGKLYNNMGQVFESLNRYEEALQHYQMAMNIQPDDVRSYLNIGRVLTNLMRYREAENIYRKAQTLLPGPEIESREEIHVTPSHLQLFVNLAFLISQNDSRLEEADALYKEAITLRSDFTNAYLNRGNVLLKMNKTKEAEAMYHRALKYDDTNPDLYYNLGVVLTDQGRNAEALEFFNKALDLEPNHEKSLELSAVLMQDSALQNHKNLAKVRLEKIVDRGKENERVYINLGLVAVDNKNFASAEKWFRKALQKVPVSREALFNLALLLSEQQRQTEAIFTLNQLLQHYPGHINGLLLLADINVNYLKNLDAAEECYRQVLKLEPTNEKALHNLCVVYFERQDYETAEECFLQTLAIYPGVSYIRHHLDVVRNILKEGHNRIFDHLTASHSVS